MGKDTIKNSMVYLQKIKNGTACDPAVSLLGVYVQRNLKHEFERIHAPLCSVQRYLQWPR